MRKKDKKPAVATFVVPNRKKFRFLWIGLAAGIGLFSIPSLIVFCIGSLPTIAAWMYDRGRDKTTGVTVGLMNIAGIMPFVSETLRGGHDMALAGPVMEKGTTWLVMYGVGGMGWLIILMMPKVTRKIIGFHLDKKRDKINKTQKDLVEEWGKKVQSFDLPGGSS